MDFSNQIAASVVEVPPQLPTVETGAVTMEIVHATPPPIPFAAPPILPPPLPRPWGFWATAGWSFSCLMLMVAVQTVVMLPFLIPYFPFPAGMAPDEFAAYLDVIAAELMGNGLHLAVTIIATAPICLALLAALVRWSRYPWRDYFGWHRASMKQSILSIVAVVVVMLGWDMLGDYIDRPNTPDFMQRAVSEKQFLPLLFVAIVIAAPVWEELFFRGFMYQGFARSPLGNLGAVVLTSIAFAAIHVQYDWYGMLTILVLGLTWGVVRWRTGSTLLTILLHGLNNLYALLVMIYLSS